MKKRAGTGPWLSRCTVLAVVTTAHAARANDVSDELTVGALRSSATATTSPYAADRVGGSVDASDELALSLDATLTRYFKSNRAPGETIVQFAAAADYTPTDHWAFGVDARASPASTAVTRTGTDTVRSRTSLLAAGISAEYDTAGEGPFETIVDSYASVSSFSTTQRSRLLGRATPSTLAQYRLSAGVTEVFSDDVETELEGSYYAYSEDAAGTGYFGPSVFGRESVSDGLPLEPLRWSARPTLRKHFGPVKLAAFFQYGRYVDSLGWSAMGGLKATVTVSDAVKLWASANFQHDRDGAGDTLSIPWGSLGVRVYL